MAIESRLCQRNPNICKLQNKHTLDVSQSLRQPHVHPTRLRHIDQRTHTHWDSKPAQTRQVLSPIPTDHTISSQQKLDGSIRTIPRLLQRVPFRLRQPDITAAAAQATQPPPDRPIQLGRHIQGRNLRFNGHQLHANFRSTTNNALCNSDMFRTCSNSTAA